MIRKFGYVQAVNYTKTTKSRKQSFFSFFSANPPALLYSYTSLCSLSWVDGNAHVHLGIKTRNERWNVYHLFLTRMCFCLFKTRPAWKLVFVEASSLSRQYSVVRPETWHDEEVYDDLTPIIFYKMLQNHPRGQRCWCCWMKDQLFTAAM